MSYFSNSAVRTHGLYIGTVKRIVYVFASRLPIFLLFVLPFPFLISNLRQKKNMKRRTVDGFVHQSPLIISTILGQPCCQTLLSYLNTTKDATGTAFLKGSVSKLDQVVSGISIEAAHNKYWLRKITVISWSKTLMNQGRALSLVR